MKLIVAGSRTFQDYTLLSSVLGTHRHHITELLHGGARGADQPRLSLGRAASRALALLRSGLGALRQVSRSQAESPDGAGRRCAGGVPRQ